MSAADTLPRTQFGDIAFPAATHVVHGHGRHHVHEYPHTPGGSPEKLGRGLYRVTIRGLFHDRFKAYPGLYPGGMARLRSYYEKQSTLTLVHPSLGSIPAFITEWTQAKDAKVRSGEVVDIDFLEDSLLAFLDISGFVAQSQASLQQLANVIANNLSDQAIRNAVTFGPKDQSLFDALQGAVNSVLAVRDTANMYGNLLGAKVAQMISLCQQVDRATSLQDPRAFAIVDSVHDLWQAGVQISLDLQNKRTQLRIYQVPALQTMSAIASHLYGDASRTSDLIALNGASAPNPLRVAPGTMINYYP